MKDMQIVSPSGQIVLAFVGLSRLQESIEYQTPLLDFPQVRCILCQLPPEVSEEPIIAGGGNNGFCGDRAIA